jgi:beta-N-acetylhexosaminidase
MTGLKCIGLAILAAATASPVSAPSSSKTKAHVSAPARSNGIPSTLSLSDRIAQLIVIRAYGDFLSSRSSEYRMMIHSIRDLHVGGFIIANRIRNGNVINAQPYEMASFVNHMQKMAKTPLLVGGDFERGASMRVAGTPRFPTMMAYGAAHDLAEVRRLGAATAAEARTLGVTWVFAPVADVNNNPDNPIINTRSFGEDPKAVGDAVAAFIEGSRSDPANRVLVTAKHFPGHGDTADDSHLQLPRLDQTKDRIETLELVPFREAIAHHVDAVMTAHIAVPAFEPEAKPATVSKNILTGPLRIIVTDAMDMQGLAALYTHGEAAVRAIEAGADVLLMPADPQACIRTIEAAVNSGRLTRRRIDESVARVLAAKRQLGLYSSRTVDLDSIADRIDQPQFEESAQIVADRAVTVVKDEKHLFPLTDPDDACLVVLNGSRFLTNGQTLLSEVSRRAPKMRTAITDASESDAELAAIETEFASCKEVYVAAFTTVTVDPVSPAKGLGGLVTRLSQGPAPVALLLESLHLSWLPGDLRLRHYVQHVGHIRSCGGESALRRDSRSGQVTYFDSGSRQNRRWPLNPGPTPLDCTGSRITNEHYLAWTRHF